MVDLPKPISVLLIAFLQAFPVSMGAGAEGEATREQVIHLQRGWNAVFLEVQPAELVPDRLFAGLPVEMVARYFPPRSSVQYISDPAESEWNGPEWGVWHSPSRPESVVGTLKAIHGPASYLIKAEEACVWTVNGRVRWVGRVWRPDSFNLAGFGVRSEGGPTFAQYFAGAQGRVGQRIYELDPQGYWQLVVNPATTRIEAGRAYWVYCDSLTDYGGPLEVAGVGGEQVELGLRHERLDLEFRNHLSQPLTVRVEVAAGDLPLACGGGEGWRMGASWGAWEQPVELGPVAAGGAEVLRVALRREAMTATAQWRLLKVTTSEGICQWVPLWARGVD